MTRRHFYLAAQLGFALLAACRAPRTTPVGHFEPASRDELGAVASGTTRAGHQLLRIRWRTDDGQTNVSGSGAVRMAPDSLRIDMAVRLGVGRATLILAGDHVQADPEQLVSMLLPDRFALWAALGVVKLPDSITTVERLSDGARTFWRVTDATNRQWTFEMHGDTLAGVVRAQGDRPIARLALTRGPDGDVSRALATDLQRGARFEFEIVSRVRSEAFPDETWQLRP